MKKVALLSDGWKRLITYAWVDGIMEKIEESGEEVSLYQYNCFGNWSLDKKHNQGEYNIYNLPNLEEYDGIILECTNIVDKDVLKEVVEMLKEVSIPVVSLGHIIDEFYYVGIDNTSTIMKLMDHLYEVHGCRDFVFAGGSKCNSENLMRVAAFKQSLEKYNLPIEKEKVLWGDYDYETGVRYMTRLYEEKWELPDAIVCANDNIAAGICTTAEKFGLRVPDDFLVTGFNNEDKASYFRPQITTANINRKPIAYKAMELLLNLWKGKSVEHYNFVDSQCVIGESCGCANNGLVDYREYVRDHIIQNIKKQQDEERLMQLVAQLTLCKTFDEIFEKMGIYFNNLECDGFSIIVDRKLFDSDMDINETFSKKGYCIDDMRVCWVSNQKKKLEIHTVEDLYDHIKKDDPGNAYMFTPIHFRENTIGFTVLKNGNFSYDNPYFYDIHIAFCNALENLMNSYQKEKIYQKLKNMYDKDPMTGLYNRMAYTDIIKPKFQTYCTQDIACALIFFDVDSFKEMNDTLGHDYGDQILKKIAVILKEKCPDDGYAYRFGGDEFVVFFPHATKEKVYYFTEEIKKEFQAINISISQGTVITEPKNGKTLDEYLVLADQKMYEVKKRKIDRYSS